MRHNARQSVNSPLFFALTKDLKCQLHNHFMVVIWSISTSLIPTFNDSFPPLTWPQSFILKTYINEVYGLTSNSYLKTTPSWCKLNLVLNQFPNCHKHLHVKISLFMRKGERICHNNKNINAANSATINHLMLQKFTVKWTQGVSITFISRSHICKV